MIILEPTAALVMAMSEDVFRASPLTSRYFDRLDLSSADALVRDHEEAGIVGPMRDVLNNRKFGVRHVVLEALRESAAPVQVVLLAAGKSPLGLELLAELGAKVARVFEVDVTPFDAKAALYQELLPQSGARVRFIEQDIVSEALMPRLVAEGYVPDAPTLVVLEGITHYISHAQCQTILSRFVSADHRATRVLVEFAPPIEGLNATAQGYARTVFGIVEQRHFPQGMVKYPHAWLRETFAKLGGRFDRIVPMHEMEHLRLGRNEAFPTADSGWIELALGWL